MSHTHTQDKPLNITIFLKNQTFVEKKFWSTTNFFLNKFWFENVFETNKISGLKNLGPEKFGSWNLFWVLKKFFKKNLGEKLILGPLPLFLTA